MKKFNPTTLYKEKTEDIKVLSSSKEDVDELLNSIRVSEKQQKFDLEAEVDPLKATEGVKFVSAWQRYKREPGVITHSDEDCIKIEFLVNKEEGEYVERIFEPSFFTQTSIKEGNYIIFNYYRKGDDHKIEISDNQSLILDDDFPNHNFDELANLSFLKS